jgi:hypothetical protein
VILKTAEAQLHPEIQMIFPGGTGFKSLDQLVARARPGYRDVAKHVERIDVSLGATGDIAFVQGTLYGHWPDGETLKDIRLADWFEFEDGIIRRQRVWNDIGEACISKPGVLTKSL